MIYCMADIHGAYDRYLEMLRLIRFSDEDTLYVIGDVIDRGAQGIETVLDLMGRSNVILLRGNHEQMCLDDLHRHIWDARALWQKNGGSRTRSDLLYKRTPVVRSRILHYFLHAPTCVDVEVNGRMSFIKVHDLLDTLEEEVKEKTGVIITLHGDPVSDDQDIRQLRKIIKKTTDLYDGFSYHDLHYNKNLACYHVDISIPYSYDLKKNDIIAEITRQVREYNKDIRIQINIDRH